MPTYEYQCDSCRRIFEVRQRISEPALTTCEVCSGPVRRLLSAAPFILKGEGWYVTDYPSEARKKARSEEKSSSSPSTTSDKTDKTDKSDKADKADKADKPAAAPAKTDGAASGAASGASTPKSSD